MTYYSILDNDLVRIMSSGRNSKTLDDLAYDMLDYHLQTDKIPVTETCGDFDEEDIQTVNNLFKTNKGKIEFVTSYGFSIIEHEEKLPDDDYDEMSNNWGDIDYKTLDHKELLQRFDV